VPSPQICDFLKVLEYHLGLVLVRILNHPVLFRKIVLIGIKNRSEEDYYCEACLVSDQADTKFERN